MKNLFKLITSVILLSFSAFAASPTYNSFQTGQFATNNLLIAVKSNALLTNSYVINPFFSGGIVITNGTTISVYPSSFFIFDTTASVKNAGEDEDWNFKGATEGKNTNTILAVRDFATDQFTFTSQPTNGLVLKSGAAVTNLVGADGSAAVPTYAFSVGSTNTGIFLSGADAIGFSTDGTERWVINSSGAFNPLLNHTYSIGNGTVNVKDVHVSGRVFEIAPTNAITAVGDTITATNGVVMLDPDANYALTSTPTIAAGSYAGQKMVLMVPNGEANTVELIDAGTLAGTTLELGDTNRIIGNLDVLVLYWNGANWVEASFQAN